MNKQGIVGRRLENWYDNNPWLNADDGVCLEHLVQAANTTKPPNYQQIVAFNQQRVSWRWITFKKPKSVLIVSAYMVVKKCC